jgi:glycosyltransferase involved in cell wall biosynthesis
MLCPGGLEHSGGIGRWAGYVLDDWQDKQRLPRLEVVDTRGHGDWFVGAVTFGHALVRIITLGLSGRLELIHANLSVRGSSVRKCAVALVAKLIDVRLVVHLHSGRFFLFYADLPPLGQWAVRRLFHSANCVIVLGQIWADQVEGVLGVPRAKINVLYSGVRVPDRLSRDSPPDGVPHIVMLGRLGPPKGLPELLEALGSDRMRHLPWRVTVAGDGDTTPYRDITVGLEIADRVTFPGWISQDAVSQLLQEADILVLPSRSENLPVSVIEGMAHRIALVATPVGALPELLEDGVSALIVPIGDPGALSMALASLISDPALRMRLARAGHAVFLDRLELSAASASLASLYSSVMSSEPAVVEGKSLSWKPDP